MKVKDAIHKGATWVEPDTALATVARKMRSEDIDFGQSEMIFGWIQRTGRRCHLIGIDHFYKKAGQLSSS